jgi:hypothetical protein
MKKNQYGNIEDLLVHLTIVTPKGTIQVKFIYHLYLSINMYLKYIIISTEKLPSSKNK